MAKDFLYPLRKLHGRLVEKRLTKAEARALEKEMSAHQTVLLGTPSHTNIGDSAIVAAELAFLSRGDRSCFEVTTDEMRRFPREVLRCSKKAQLLFWHGGGNMGDQWFAEEKLRRQTLMQVREKSVMIFPQTVHYTDTPKGRREKEASVEIYNRKKGLIIAAREEASFSIAKELYPDAAVLLTPDIVLSATPEIFGAKPQKRQGVLLCMRSDAERSMTDEQRKQIEQTVTATGTAFRYTDMYADRPVTKENRVQCVREKLEELSSARLVITDRLHGMVFAAITGTPCIVFSNYNHKVKGTYQWIKYLPYIRYVETAAEAERLLPEMLAMGGQVYDDTPLQSYFDTLRKAVEEM